MHQYGLAPRRIHVTVAGKDRRPARVCQAVLARLVVKRALRRGRPAQNDAVLVAQRREARLERVAARADGEEEVVVLLVLVHDGAFDDGGIGARVSGNVSQRVGVARPREQLRAVGQVGLVDAVPEAAKGEVDRAGGRLVEDEGVDEVVVSTQGQADRAVVLPCARLQRFRRCDADGGVL